MAIYLQCLLLVLFLSFSGFKYSVVAQEPDDTETWRGSKRLIVIEDIYPFKEKKELRWVRGWMCGWTPHGLCFSPDWRRDIHDNFMIPFKNLKLDVYCDEPADPGAFGINSVVLARFSKKKLHLWEANVRSYWADWDEKRSKSLPYSISVTTDYFDLGKKQLKESFPPHKLRLKEAHDACRYFRNDCLFGERCVSRRISGHIWPGEYKCVCSKRGFQEIRGRGCVDVDECEMLPCGALFVCVNTFGSYKCHCKSGYKGKQCEIDIDECQENPCPDNSACKNVPGSFQCTCLPGYEGEDCSEKPGEEAAKGKTRPPIIKEYTKKRIAIPRKTPTKTIKRPVFSYDSRHKERAGMITLMVFFNFFGVFLYWWQKKKRAKTVKKENKDNCQSSKEEMENDETISSNKEEEGDIERHEQEIKICEGITSNQELNISSNNIPASQELDENETVSRTSSNQELETSAEDRTTSQVLEDSETVSDQTLSRKSLEDLDAIASNQKLQKSEIVLGNQALENPETSSNDQEIQNTENILSSEETDAKLIHDNHKLS